MSRKFNRTVKQIDWDEKARAWGLDPDAPRSEPEVDGPLVDVSQRFHDELACPGSFRIVEDDGPIWIARCDHCRADVGVSARKQDPAIRRQARLIAAGLPSAFAGKPFDRLPDVQPVLAQLRQWLGGFDANYRRHPDDKTPHPAGSLLPAPVLFGLPGRGKTHLLTTICERVICECDLPAAFYSTRSLLRDLQRFDDDVHRGRAWERATKVEVLVLDDVGAEQGTDWRLDQLADLVDERYQRELPVVAATNYAPRDWELVLDERTVSRLRHMTFPLELKGADRRLEEAA